MICKKDIIMWFKELESYKRIDTMCTLLNMCLPFELRFLGTCLEELGRRDSQELRGIELRVNNPQDLAADMVACQKGEPTDKKIRRKMALYLALIRACNRTCVTEIFRTLKGWEDCDFMNMTDADTLQELLLVYTMAANHPVFSFEQHMKCTEIFEKIKKNKLVAEPQPMTASASAASGLNQYGVDSMSSSGYTASATQAQPQQTLPTPQTQQQQQQPQHMPTQQEMLQLNAYHFATNTAGQHQQIIQMLPQGINFQQAHHVTKLIPTADASLSHQITVDSIPAQMLTSNITIPADSTSAMLTHPNAWMRPYPPPQGPGMEMKIQHQHHLQHPPQASSPMLSQQSSPASSRTASPNRNNPNGNLMQQIHNASTTQQMRNINRMSGSLKNVRRPSAETTPPPIPVQQMEGPTQQQQQSTQQQQMMSRDIILPQNMKNVDESSGLVSESGSSSQLQALIRNGYNRSALLSRSKTGTYVPPHQQQQQQQQQQQSPVSYQSSSQAYAAVSTLPYNMQSMYITENAGSTGHSDAGGSSAAAVLLNSIRPTNSESTSPTGSSGETSPPETPTSNIGMNLGTVVVGTSAPAGLRHHQTIGFNKQMNLNRLNGRSDKLSNTQNVMYAPTAMPQSQALYATDIVLAPGGNAGSMGNNNNAAQAAVQTNTQPNSSQVAASNNNMSTSTVLISSGTPVATNGSQSQVILQSPHQPPPQQYTTSYPFHAAPPHLQSTSRPPLPLMTHQSAMAPGNYRLPGGFPMPHNGEIMYPAYHHGIAFLSGAAPPPSMRSAASAASVTAAAVQSSNAAAVAALSQQLQSQTTQSQQQVAALPPNALISSSSLASQFAPSIKPISCYNCGSQLHNGSECQEASMDDMARANYQLNYSVVSTNSNTSPTSSLSSSLATGGSSSDQSTSTTSSSSNSSNTTSIKTHSSMESNTTTAGSTAGSTTAAAVSK